MKKQMNSAIPDAIQILIGTLHMIRMTSKSLTAISIKLFKWNTINGTF